MVRSGVIGTSGNSLCVRVPREMLERLGWARGTGVLVTVVDTAIVVTRFDHAAAYEVAKRVILKREPRAGKRG